MLTSHYGDQTIFGSFVPLGNLSILLPVKGESSLECRTYCDMGHNGHLRGTVTLTPAVEHLAVELSLSVLMI